MKLTFTHQLLKLKSAALLFCLFFFAAGFSTFAHSVTGYTTNCGTGPSYSIDATVINVNATSNYAWQYKNASNAWVCITNGNNTIYGHVYNVSGATSTATINPGPLVFTNPNSNLQGLVIRCVISDGSGVNPCSTPSGNTWNSDASSVNQTISVTGSACGTNTTDCACTNGATNLLTNGSFENGNTGWNVTGGTITTGTGYIICGAANGFLNWSSGTAIAWQQVSAIAGNTYNASAYLGTHTPGISCSPKFYMSFYNASGTFISRVSINVTTDVDVSPNKPALYSLTGVAPAGTASVRVEALINCNTMKMDAFCLTTTNTNTASIGDRVWLDANGNGLQDASETGGITGVSVQLKNSGGTVIATTTTNATGNYLFSGLAAGNYTVVFPTNISGTVVTPQNVGSNDNIDSDASPTTGATPTITLAAGQNITNVDAGYCPTTLELGNRVWYDTNNNGINDSENGIANATVYLYKDNNNDNVADGASIATEITDANGFYNFTNLAPGNYIVGVVTPTGYMSSSVNGGDPDNDINLDDNGQVTVGNETRGLAITLVAGTEPDGSGAVNTNNNGTYDFGFLPDCSCTNSAGNLLVNGSFENGTTGWTWSGGTLTTGTGYVACGAANGFNNWSSGTSKVYQDVNIPAGATVTFSAFAGTHTPGISCSPTLSLIYLNSTGGVISQSNVIVTRDVDINFSQLAQYTITGVTPVGTTKVRVQSSITCNTMKLDAFCLTAVIPATYTLGNNVWNDQNNNGIKDASETGIAGVVVKLYDCAGTYLNKTATTDASGNYQFTALAAGSYIVGITTPAGYTKSDVGNTNVGSDNQNDGVTIVTTEIRTACFTTTGSTNNIDFGLKGTGSIGDFVFNDANGNGLQDAGEVGIANATVTLTYPNGATLVTTTNASGIYNFANLAPGTYSVAFTTPTGGYLISPSNVGANDAIDSDPIGGVVSGIVLTAGQTNTTVDAGFYICQALTSGINGPATICANEAALFTATGAGAGSVYTWTFMNGSPATATGSSVTSTWNTPGEYDITLTVTKNGCTATYTRSIVITQSVFSNAGPNADICSGSSTTLVGSGPTGSNYSWTVISGDPTSIDNGANQSSVLVSPLITTTYQLTVSQNGCTRTSQVTVFINVNKNPVADAGPNKTTLINTPVTIGGSPTGTPPLATPGAALGYIWSPSTGLNSNTVANPTVTISTPGVYNYQVIVYSIATGCSDTSTVSVTVLQPVNIGNTVFYDKNGNGIKDATDQGIFGATVKLYKDDNNDNIADGAALATISTTTTGIYSFANLYPGNYIVGVVIPSGYAVVATNGGDPDNNIDNDNNGVNTSVAGEVRSLAITLLGGTEPDVAVDGDNTNGNLTVDFAFKGTGSIGDFVWNDINRNGIQDAGEAGIANATVTLTFSDGTSINTLTNASGAYSFSNLAPGTYSITFITPAGKIPTLSNSTGTGATDLNDSDPVGGVVSGITLTPGQINNTVDAGFYSPINLYGNVFHDANALTDNEVNKTSDVPIPNALNVYLINNTTGLIEQAEGVLSNGTFSFENVKINNSYRVLITTIVSGVGDVAPRVILPSGWKVTGENLGAGPNSGDDGVRNGILFIDTELSDLNNINFGIRIKNGEIVVG